MRIQAKLTREPADAHVPPVVSWIVTGRCNMRCVHCYPASGPDSQGSELSFEQRSEAVRRLASGEVRAVFLSGGEVLLLPYVFDLIEQIHRGGMTSWICTNGSLVSRATAARIAALGVLGVSVSLDSPCPAVHDRFRAHAGAHAKALQAIAWLRDAGVTVNVDYTATRANREEAEALLPLAGQLGVKSVFVKRFRPLGRGLRNAECLALSLEDYGVLVRRMRDAAAGCGPQVRFEDPAVRSYLRQVEGDATSGDDGVYARYGCLAGIVWLGLQPNGDVTPCPLLAVPLGNILRHELKALVAGSPLLRRLADRDDRGGRCATCVDRRRCGGCRAHALAVSGDCFAEDPFCARSLAADPAGTTARAEVPLETRMLG